MRIAIVHHWFVTQGGGERVAEVIGSMFPEADLFTLVADPSLVPPGLAALARRKLWGVLVVSTAVMAAVFTVNLSYPEWTGGWSTGPGRGVRAASITVRSSQPR